MPEAGFLAGAPLSQPGPGWGLAPAGPAEDNGGKSALHI